VSLAVAALVEPLVVVAEVDITELVPLERLALQELVALVPMVEVVALLAAQVLREARGAPELLCRLLLPAESLRVLAVVAELAAQVGVVALLRISVVAVLAVLAVLAELGVVGVLGEESLFFILQPLLLTARP